MTKSTPFTKLLIANRGEIALRVLRSAKAAGYRTVAVYSRPDAGSLHVLQADQAVCIGEALPADSYLRIDAILDAAKHTGADAVHPGYGFLAENAAFAQAVRDAGLVFIGPSPDAIARMGHKAGAKNIMQAAGVPCVQGYQGEDQDEKILLEEAARIGWPVMIKAVAGGGGRGMRLVENAQAFGELLRSARSEALNAFGDATVILERAIRNPRHIEIQVFADRHGNAIHLGERDCSVQRRHQKLIEEAPSPVVGAELRERMGATAVAAVKAIGYEGAGTLEFLLDESGEFFFMEMNTRLQVEHPVTEAITGLDLVALQLSVAAGAPLPLKQEDVRFSGHAIEVRLCAEDAHQGFMPQSGTLACWQPAAGVRVEHGLCSGSVIPPFYDSMVAKLIAVGATREEARRRLVSGLQDTVALGVTTNQGFLAACLQHPVFADGAATTGFIGQHLDELLGRDESAHGRALSVAAVLLFQSAAQGETAAPSGLVRRFPLHMVLGSGSRSDRVSLRQTGPHAFVAERPGGTSVVELVVMQAHTARVVCDGVMAPVAWALDRERICLSLDGHVHEFIDGTRAATARKDVRTGGDGRLRASMNGRAVAVLVQTGERVTQGQPLVTLEAMKMEHVHFAPAAGTVRAVHLGQGDQVPSGRVMVEIEVDAPATLEAP